MGCKYRQSPQSSSKLPSSTSCAHGVVLVLCRLSGIVINVVQQHHRRVGGPCEKFADNALVGLLPEGNFQIVDAEIHYHKIRLVHQHMPQVRALGRHAGRDPLTLFWTASGMECSFTGSELWVEFFADYEVVEPWVSVELNGAWVARFAVNPGKSRVCLFRGMTPGKAKRVRLLKDVQAMHDDPAHLLQITGLEYTGGEFLPLPEPKYRLEFVGDSITSGEGAIGAKPEEDWVGAFFSAENHYGRLTAFLKTIL